VTYLRIKENPEQPFGLPDWPNDRIYPQIRHKADFLTRSILKGSPHSTIVPLKWYHCMGCSTPISLPSVMAMNVTARRHVRKCLVKD
jgi:acyl-CoA synthetase (AMP-forming)/AMP-acid ligase II